MQDVEQQQGGETQALTVSAFPPAPEAKLSGRRLALGAVALTGTNIFKMLLQFVSLPLMARLLGPSEFGLYAMAMPLVALISMLADGGLGISLAREPENSPIWSTAFWTLLGAGIVLAAFLDGSGIVLGVFLHQPRLPQIMAVLSLTVICITITAPALARLDRQGRMAIGAIADLAGNALGITLAIICAFHGAGAWSLVVQYCTIFLTRCIIVNAAAFHLPRFEFSAHLLRSHITVGGLVVGTRASEYFTRMAENLTIGHILGPASLGLYIFSNQIPRFVCDTAGGPLWLAFYVRALRSTPDELAALQLRLSRLLVIVLFPAAALSWVLAPSLVTLFMGNKWAEAAPLLQILFPSYVVIATASQGGAALLAGGKYHWQFFGTSGLGLMRTLAACTALWFGISGVALGVAAASIVYAFTMFAAAAEVSGCNIRAMLGGFAGPFFASLCAAGTCWAGTHGITAPLSVLVVGLPLGFTTYAAISFLVDYRRLTSDIAALSTLIMRRTPV